MYDKYRKRHQAARPGDRLRRQIALEAARRLFPTVGPRDGETTLREASGADFYTAKVKAAAVLGHRVRPGDLPSDSEVREQILRLAEVPERLAPVDEDEAPEVVRMADHLDRFALYRLRLGPLESVKQNARTHPEGDALYHSLQVFGLAREARPYDEEFLLAALLHDVGKAIDPADHVAAGVEALRGAVTDRTLWLIEHHGESRAYRERTLNPRARQALDRSEYLDDLLALRELDEAGRVAGAVVGSVDEALDYLRGLEAENDHGG